MTTSADAPEGGRRARLVAAFLSGIRTGADQHEHFGWAQAYADRTLAPGDRTERLGLPAAYLVAQLCYAGKRSPQAGAG